MARLQPPKRGRQNSNSQSVSRQKQNVLPIPLPVRSSPSPNYFILRCPVEHDTTSFIISYRQLEICEKKRLLRDAKEISLPCRHQPVVDCKQTAEKFP